MSSRYTLGLCFLCFLDLVAFGQPNKMHGHIETGILMGTSGRIPFWMLSNQYGRFSPKSGNGYLEAGLFSDSIQKEKKFGWDWGIDGFGRYDGKATGWLQQGYVGGKAWFMYLYAGLKEEHFGDQNPQLSSGFPTWSGNARPMPQISLSTLDYIPVPLTKGFVETKFGIAHGWFGGDGYVKGVLLHHKYVYLRFGGKSKFHFTAGLHHFVQWGGVSPDWGRLPSSFKDFLKIFVAYSGHDSIPGVPWNEWANRIGNHLGTKDFMFDYTFSGGLKAKLYWQNFIEDITGIEFRMMANGLWGFTLEQENKMGFCYEFIHTSSFNNVGNFDNYFVNNIYKSGWTFHGYVIGNPMITSPLLFKSDANYPGVQNNRVIVHYLSAFYEDKAFEVSGKFSYSINMGMPKSYTLNPPRNQFSMELNISKKEKKKCTLVENLGLAWDKGTLFGNHLGFNFTIEYLF